MSYFPSESDEVYGEMCSRRVLLGRFSLHVFAPGHNRGEGRSTGEFATLLRKASEDPFSCTEEHLNAYGPLLTDIGSCPHLACELAWNQGPVGLKNLFRSQIGDKGGLSCRIEIQQFLSEFKDLLSGSQLKNANFRIKDLASLLNDPATFDRNAASGMLNHDVANIEVPNITVPGYRGFWMVVPQTRRGSARVFRGSDNEMSCIFSSDGPLSSIHEIQARFDSEFKGRQTAVTRSNAHFNYLQNFIRTSYPDYIGPHWTLRTVDTGHLSGAAWYQRQGGSYSLVYR